MPRHIVSVKTLKDLESGVDEREVAASAKKLIDKILREGDGSGIENSIHEFPRFTLNELKLSTRPLGVGGFSSVFEIQAVTIEKVSISVLAEDTAGNNQERQRLHIAENCIRCNEARYALKKLSPETKQGKKKFILGLADLALETKFLSSSSHPNILRMRAVSDASPHDGNHFIVLDRLYDTLDTRLENEWRKVMKKANGGLFRKGSSALATELYMTQIQYSFDLAAALQYLHSRNIIYRDLKPENIGMDIRDDVKLFDFGLIRELKPQDRVGESSVYHLTHRTGSLRYMAPENALCKPYGCKSDVYSFGVLLWQILSCQKPYEVFFPGAMNDVIFSGPKKRPSIPRKWRKSIQSLIEAAWSDEEAARPCMEEICLVLRQELILAGQDESLRLGHSRRRSTLTGIEGAIPEAS